MKKYLYLGLITGVLIILSCKHHRNYYGELITDNPCDSTTVYFQNSILPIISSRCAMPGCHDKITHAEGIDLSDYFAIMNANSENGLLVVYDHPNSSTLYTSSLSGSMPPYPYDKLSSNELDMIYHWIDQGAFNNFCDVCDTNKYQFGLDIYPIFQSRCVGCHGSINPSGAISLTNYIDIKTQVNNFEIQGVIADPANYPVMPPSIGLPFCEKTKILKWIGNGAPNN